MSLPRTHLRQGGLRLAALACVLAACGAPGGSPPDERRDADASAAGGTGRRPKPEIVESLRADLAAVRHPSDGGGHAWLEEASGPATVGSPGRWTIGYRAGPLGIDAGGVVFLQVSPFWGWSTPQTSRPESPGFTEVTTSAEGVELEAETLDQQLLGIRVGGRRLEEGEELRIVYGAGPAGARADRFAEGDSRFWIAVDGDGDGIRRILADSPGVAVGPGPAARLVVTLPSAARPGAAVRLTVAVVDGSGNAGVPLAGEIRFEGTLDGEPLDRASLPAPMTLDPAELGRETVEWTVPEAAGVVRLRGLGPRGLESSSNPLQLTGRGALVYWGDLQNHSAYSDGTALPEEEFLYARDVAALDVFALTDHDHWGMLPLDRTPSMWEEIRELTGRFNEPGRFVTLLGFEWTNWVHGHRHVLYFDGDGEVLSSVDEAYDHPEELWQALEGEKALTFAHHSAGGPISTDWTIAPPPEIEPVTEIVSVHGSSEAPDSPGVIHRPVAGNFVRDALARGYRLGFIGSSDGHDGHPGLAQFASPTGGLAAILAEELTRDAVYEAFRRRSVYATNGPRILLRVSFAGWRMGADVPLRRAADGTWAAAGGPVDGIPDDTLVVQAIAPGEIERIDVVRSGAAEGLLCDGGNACSFTLGFAELSPGEYVYVRVVQTDGGAAWSSPFYFIE